MRIFRYVFVFEINIVLDFSIVFLDINNVCIYMLLYVSIMIFDRSVCIVRRDSVILDDVISFFYLEIWRGCFIVFFFYDCYFISFLKFCL